MPVRPPIRISTLVEKSSTVNVTVSERSLWPESNGRSRSCL